MPLAATARRSVARTTLWLLSFISAYVLVGTWAFTPELARASIAREVSATAVPPRTLATRKPSVLRAGRNARRADSSQERRPPASGFLLLADEHSRVIAQTRRVASATGAATARNRNRVLYEATPPPAA